MFQLDISPFGKFTTRRYFTEDNTISFTIVPEQGAVLTDFQYNGHPIIEGCKTPAEVEFNDWGKSWLLFPFPNRLQDGQYEWEDKRYQFPINETQNHHALHGFLHECTFEFLTEEVTEEYASVTLQTNDDGARPYYPFPFQFTITYRVDRVGTFTVNCAVLNTGKTSFPMGLGWHPYFQLGGKANDLYLQTPPVDLVGIDSRMIPTGKTYDYTTYTAATKINAEVLDNCFLIKNTDEAKIQLTDQQLTIEFQQPTDIFPYVQLFTPPSRQSVAIEPMTCNIDAFNNGEGLIKLAPQERWQGTFGFTVTSL